MMDACASQLKTKHKTQNVILGGGNSKLQDPEVNEIRGNPGIVQEKAAV